MVSNIEWSYHAFQRNKKEYDVCGDSFFIGEFQQRLVCVVADGLGSGPNAHDSAERVTQAVSTYGATLSLQQLMHKCNDVLRMQRGAVASIMYIDFEQQTLQYCGVGNISCYFIHDNKVSYPKPHYGYLAGKRIEPFVETISFTVGDRCFLHSDGIEVNEITQLIDDTMWQALEHDDTEQYLTYKDDDLTYVMLNF